MPPIPRRPPLVLSDLQRGFRVVVIGDSRTGSNTYVGADTQDAIDLVNAAVTTDSWFTIASYLTNQRLYHGLGSNRGIGGNDTAQQLARFTDEVVNSPGGRPARVILASSLRNIGSGNVGGQVTDQRIADSASDLLAMTNLARGAGIQAVWITAYTASLYTGDDQATLDKHNTWRRDYARRYGIPIIDVHRATVDPATGVMQSAYTTDGTHLTFAGAKAVAQEAATVLNAVLPPSPLLLAERHTASSNAANLLPNPCFQADANSDGVPDGWRQTAGSGTAALATDSAVVGKWLTLTQNGSGSSNGVQIQLTNPVASGASTFSPGDRLRFSGLMETSGGFDAGDIGARIYVAFTRSAGGGINVPIVNNLRLDLSAFVFSQELIVPTNTTALDVFLTLQHFSGGASEVMKVGQVRLTNMTTLGAV